MTNEELVERVARNPIVSQDIESVREQIEDSLRLVNQTVHRHAKGFWLKENDNFTLSAGDHTINLRGSDYFPDLVDAKYFWTATGPIRVKPEKWFREKYPDPSEIGTPTLAIWLTSYNFRFHPIPTSDTTIYLSYLYRPNFSDIEEFPDFLHDIIHYGVLSAFEDIPSQENSFTRGKWTKLYINELNTLGQESLPPSSEWEPRLVFNKEQGDRDYVQGTLNRF